MMHAPLFTGVCTALPTPFREGGVDTAALAGMVRRQIAAGIPALLACGTTGEASTLEEAEWAQALQCVLEASRGQALVIAGTGTNNLRHTAARAQTAAHLGADAQLVVTPYYNKTTQRGLVDYYFRVAEASELPILLYNVPGRTGMHLLPDTAARLAEHPRIIGIKEAGGSLNQMADLLALHSLPVYCGSDAINAPALRLGAAGVISVLSNLLPGKVARLCRYAQAGRFREADALQAGMQPLTAALFSETSPAPLKAALALQGCCRVDVRSPLVTVQPETLERLRALLPTEENP